MSVRPFVFVIMPFAPEYADRYNVAIKPACESAGAICQRVDEQIFLQNILERIYGEIERADLIVSEMSGRNPNVFYETGYAHGLGKPVILVTQSADDIPFDLRHYPHVVYGSSLTILKEKLQERVSWCIAHPDELAHHSPRHAERAQLAFDQIGKHITNYMRANNFTKVSFERIRKRINASYTDDLLLRLIERSPDHFRRTNMGGDKPGIGLVAEID
jgi:hypothetical protein